MSALTIVRHIAARPAVVFDAMTSADGMAAWWGPDDGPVLVAESDPRVGGAYRVRFRTLDGNEHEARGTYLVVDPPRHARMTFRWEGRADAPSEIEITIEPEADGTRLTFVHSGLRDEAVRDDHREGWSDSFDKLAAYCEKG
jgi:uncharacterized protein YndB with AHSA1/START domain